MASNKITAALSKLRPARQTSGQPADETSASEAETDPKRADWSEDLPYWS